MPSISVSAAYLVALFAESIAYGVHVVTFATCMRTWLRRPSRSLPRSTCWPWIVIAISLLALCTLHVALACYHNLWAFTLYHGNAAPGEIFNILSNWITGIRVSYESMSFQG